MREFILTILATLCIVNASTIWPPGRNAHQIQMQAHRVPGSNNAAYGPVPVEEQVFSIYDLEIAPTPIPTDRVFFLLLRGEMPSSQRQFHNDADLARASFTATSWTAYLDGEVDEPGSITLPLRTTTYREDAHLAIRNATGSYVDYLTIDGPNNILLDMALPGVFMPSGLYTYQIDAGLEDGTCLFALSLTQELKGARRWL